MTKRVHYFVDKKTIEKIIEYWYRDDAGEVGAWDKFYELCNEHMPAHCRTAMCSLVQAMSFAETLTVDNLYNAIIASGINTRLEETYD